MARQARGEVINPVEVQVIHAVQRCVRRAFLCGYDSLTGKSYEHRRGWIRDRLEQLAGLFAIDCLTYSVMHNHLHVILRSRPDVAETWSDKEVARRWLRLFPVRRNDDGTAAEPSESELSSIVNDPASLAERRRRLSDVSWWMRCLDEPIARRANREDECTGHFWEGRFTAQVLLDETSLLACAAYVDLNPIRAALAQTPEESQYTGAKDRLDDLKGASQRSLRDAHSWERSGRECLRSGWLSPIALDPAHAPTGADADDSGRRASRKGFLNCTLESYVQLLDWTGRQLREGKAGSIPTDLEPILTRIGLEGGIWCELVKQYGRMFKRAAGTPEHLREEAVRRGLGWMQAPGNPLPSTPDTAAA